MINTYHIEMNGGAGMLHIEAPSAAMAIQRALEQNLGFKVVRCYSGKIGQEPPFEGGIDYDVPPHDALPEDYRRPKRRHPDHTIPMFDDAEIRAESARARAAS